jgi:hypothetical protein
MLHVHMALKIQQLLIFFSYMCKTCIIYCELVSVCETLNVVLLNFPLTGEK